VKKSVQKSTSASDSVKFLVIITLDHFHRFSEFINASAHTHDEGAAAVAESVDLRLREEREKNLFPALSLYSASYPRLDRSARRRIVNACASAIQTLWTVHKELLRLVAGPWVRPEASIFLQECLECMTTKPVASLVLTDRTTFHTETPTGTPTIIGIPKIYFGSPLSWPNIAHELAHNILVNRKLLARASEKFASWSYELASDYLAVKILGPSFIAAWVESLILQRFVVTDVPTHPSLVRRWAFVLSTMPRGWVSDPLVSHCKNLVDCLTEANESTERKVVDRLVPSVIESCPSCQQPLPRIIDSAGSTADYENLVRSLPDELNGIPITDYALDTRTVAQLSRQLEEGLLASAVIRGSQSLYRSVRSMAAVPAHDRLIRFEELVKEVIQKPARIAQIVHAGWLFKLRVLERRFDACVKSFDEARAKEFCDQISAELSRVDEFLLASINTAHFHRAIEGLDAAI
jgi:hypothetical protein